MSEAKDESRTAATDLRIFGRLLPFLWRQAEAALRLRLFAALLLIVATSVLVALAPVLFKDVVDRLDARRADALVALPAALVLAYLGAQFLARFVAELRWLAYGRLEQRIQRRITLALFDHIHGLTLRFHLGRRTGGLQQVIANGLLGYRMILFNTLFFVLPLTCELIFVSGVLARFYAPGFLVIVLGTASLYVASFVFGVERQRKPQRAATSAYVDAFARAADSFLNYETIKHFGSERWIRARLDDALTRGEDGWSRFYAFRSVMGLVQALWLTLGLAGVVILAGRGVARGTLTLGDFVLVNTYMLQLWRPLELLGFAYREIKMGLTYVENLLELLDERAEVADAPDAVALPAGPGALRFSAVGFAYDARRPILEDVSFHLPAGRTVALVGPSGSGKSTIARLVFRFYDVGSGEIALDGLPLRATTLASLRAAIATVPQDTVLFNDTLAHNIEIGRPGCSRAEIEAAARHAEIHDFIASLPDGYDTVVGERGLKLSGGEKQRVAIARAVLKRPRIYLFDEATSALDSETERAIQRNLETVSRGVTTLIIAHRLSTVTRADEILVLVDGRIAERGRHEALLARNGTYAAMWRRQQHESVEEDFTAEAEASND